MMQSNSHRWMLVLALGVLLVATGARAPGCAGGAATDDAAGVEAKQSAGEGGSARTRTGARPEGDRHPEGHQQSAGSCALDALHRGRLLREPEPPRPAPGLHHEVRGHPAAAGQAARDHVRRRSRLRVLLRRQNDDGVLSGRKRRCRCRCPADDRRRAEGGLRLRCDLFPVHRRHRRRPLRGHRRCADPRVLHWPIPA